MVHNPIYDGPVYESVPEQRFDSLTSVFKQDLSSSSTSACDSPDPYSSLSPDNILINDSSHKNPRYLDRPIQPRSLTQSLARNLSDHDSNATRSVSVSVPNNTRLMALKKNGKERNKLHLTLTLNNQDDSDTSPASIPLSFATPGNKCLNPVISSRPEVDEYYYTVMSPVTDSVNQVVELSPEDTEKYKE